MGYIIPRKDALESADSPVFRSQVDAKESPLAIFALSKRR